MTLTAAPPVAPGRPTAVRRWSGVAALGAAGAGVLHVVAAADHRAAGQLAVGLFLLAALAQLAGAWLLAVGALRGHRPPAWAAAAALAGTLVLVALYVVAHTTDLLAGLTGSEAGGHGGHGTGDHAAAGPQGHSVVTGGAVALSAEPEHVVHPPGALGTATVAFELLCALGLTALLPRVWRTRALDAQLVLGGLCWVLWLTGVLG